MIAAEDLARSPAWLPLGTAGADGITLVHLDEEAYRAASFLDRRLLTLGYRAERCEPATVEAAAAQLQPRAAYLFHIGHVGSTLISRLLGEHPALFALREPALLRDFAAGGVADATAAAAHPGLGLAGALALLSRTWRPGQRALIKATSFVAELAATILTGAGQPAAIFIYAQPRAYLCGILAGANSRQEMRQLARVRLARLQRRFSSSSWDPEPSTEGEYIAMSWLCEMSALQAAQSAAPTAAWVDFDTFLTAPDAGLDAICRSLGHPLASEGIDKLVRGPLMRRYSKAPEHAYDAALRREVLALAAAEHAPEVARGMRWLEQSMRRQPLLARTLPWAAALPWLGAPGDRA